MATAGQQGIQNIMSIEMNKPIFSGLQPEAPVVFDEKQHRYTMRSNGKLVPGVTTIIGLLQKDYLIPWAAKAACAHITTTADKVGQHYLVTDAMLKDAQGAHSRLSKAGRDKGTDVHDILEKYIRLRIRGAPAAPLAGNKSFKQFYEWEMEAKPEWLYNEVVVGSVAQEYGGKFDAIAVIDGNPTLIDFKTSNYYSDDFSLQLAGYQYALEEMGFDITERLVLMLRKESIGGALFEAKSITTDLRLDVEAFLGLRRVYRWKSHLAYL